MNTPALSRSGTVFGVLANILSLRELLIDERVSDSTLKRIFRSDPTVKPITMRAALENFVRAVASEYGPHNQKPPSDALVGRAVHLLTHWCHAWDTRVARIGLAGQRPHSADDHGVGFLRLVAADLGIRCGSAVWLGILPAEHLDRLGRVGRADYLRVLVNELRDEDAAKKSDATLAEECGVTPNGFSLWMTGVEAPGANHVLDLAKAVNKMDRERVSRVLLLATAERRLFERLAKTTDVDTASDLVDGLFHTAKMTNHALAAAKFSAEHGARVASELLAKREPSTGECALFVRALSELAPNPAWSLDLLSCRGEWLMRMSWWSHVLGATAPDGVSPVQLTRFFPTGPIVDARAVARVATDLDLEGLLRIQALQMMSAGEWDAAAHLWREVLRAHEDAAAHYNLAIALVRSQSVDANRREEAVALCETAIVADPGFAPAQLERGILLIDLARMPEAESQLVDARDVGADPAQCSYHLALVCEATGRPERALDLYKETLDHNPDYVDAAVNGAILARDLKRPTDARVLASVAASLGSPL